MFRQLGKLLRKELVIGRQPVSALGTMSGTDRIFTGAGWSKIAFFGSFESE
jgi:hypothetical protein